MKKIAIVLSLLFLATSCNREVPKPDHLISEGKMRLILADIYIYRQSNMVVPNARNVKYDQINMAILQKHNVSLDEFKESYDYYVINNFAYADMLTEIKDSLQNFLPPVEEDKKGKELEDDSPKPDKNKTRPKNVPMLKDKVQNVK